MGMNKRMLALWALAPLLLLRAQPADRFAGIAPRMQEFVDKREAAGVVTLIATRDRVIHLAAVGKTDMAKDRKMKTDDIFWIASMSKPITAVCIAILADDGKLSFDDPLAKHLPEFAGVMVSQNGETVKPSRPPTLRDVMTHTSGLGDMYTREPHLTLAETGKKLSEQPLRFQPGSRWAYSTAGIDVLGRVVEVVSGMPFVMPLLRRILNQSADTENPRVGSKTMPKVACSDFSGCSFGLPPKMIGNCVTQSIPTLPVTGQRIGSERPVGEVPEIAGVFNS